MEPGNDQHCNDGYNDLYIYSRHGGSVCCCGDDGYCDHYADHSDVHCDRTALSEQYGANIANNINECNYRYMVAGNDQHCNGGYNDLYIYPSGGTVCRCGNDGYCDHYADHSNVYCDWSALSELYCTIVTGYF